MHLFEAYSFLSGRRERGSGSQGERRWEELEGVKARKTAIVMYYMKEKSIFSNKSTKKKGSVYLMMSELPNVSPTNAT